MFKNYFNAALRNMLKNKMYSVINITGLAIGLSGFIIILLYLNYELSYDTWDTSLKKVYKISARTDEDILHTTPAPLGSFLRGNSSLIEAATSIQAFGDFKTLLSSGDKKIYQTGGIVADSSFFKVFPYKIIQGNAATALNKPNAIVITRELSQKLFGNDNPVGKIIKLYNVYQNEVTAIMQTPDKPSYLDAQFIWRSSYEKESMWWENYSYTTYVKTKQVLPVEKLEQDVDRIYYNNRIKKDNQSLESFRKAGHQAGLFADAMTDLHNFPKHGESNFATVSVLLLLAALLLLAGAINFSNLSIAASIRRAKEVGVRKVLGSGRRQLLWQFISEIALQCFISLCLALLLVNVILPYFNREFDISLSFFQSINIVSLCVQIIVCLLLVIILSGLYPAFFLSHYNIIKVLKGDYTRGRKGAGFRNALIVVQFTVSALFIIGTLIISSQMRYMQTKDKGFSGEQVMRLETSQKTRDANFDVTRSIFMNIPGVQQVSKTTTVPGDALSDTSTIPYKYSGKEYRMASVKVSTDYFNTLHIALLQGRYFNNGYADQNTRSAVINEAAAKRLRLSNVIGASITFPHCDSVPVSVIGVVKDFNVSGLENMVQPVVYTIGNKACRIQSGGAILLKLSSAHIQQPVAAIEQAWKKIEPDFPIRYTFLDENFEKLFASHLRLQKIINFFGFAAIFIAVMGLFALTAFLTSQRTKEIGIRKILGAGIGDLGLMLSKDFMRLILIAVVIAIPIGWLAANKWLQGFAYRINVSWWMFIVAALIVMIIAIFTIGIQTIKAAVANPVNSLRTE
jgi:putative ABC transport system permease protein